MCENDSQWVYPPEADQDRAERAALHAAIAVFRGVRAGPEGKNKRATLAAFAAINKVVQEANDLLPEAPSGKHRHRIFVSAGHVAASAFWAVQNDVDVEVSPYSSAGAAICAFASAWSALGFLSQADCVMTEDEDDAWGADWAKKALEIFPANEE